MLSSNPRSLRMIVSFVLSMSLGIVSLAGPMATTACSGGVCSADEERACNNDHGTCVASCGDGTKTNPATGLPEPDPNYQGCVSSCNDKLCSCLDSCGSECRR